MIGNQPVYVLKDGTTRERGRSAQANNILAARAVADAVRSTLGPKGMDKMLVDGMGDVVLTNDGATILKKMDVAHPAAKMLVEVATSLDDEVGDGTSTAAVLAGALLRQAEALTTDVHPTLINRGYHLAAEKAAEVLHGMAREVQPDDTKTLATIARTAMASKLTAGHADHLADLAVRAATAVVDTDAAGRRTVDVDNVLVVKKTGTGVEGSELVQGAVIDKERVHPGMPERVDAPRIALVDAALEVRKPEWTAKIRITAPDQLQAFLDEEERLLRAHVERLQAAGANVVFCQKGIDDVAQHFLAKAGIYAVRRVKKSDMEKLARATGARIVSDLKGLTEADVGSAGHVEERRIGDDRMTFVAGAADARAVTLLLRGGTEHVVEEVARSVDDALGVVRTVLEDGRVLPGAGAPEIAVALRLREYAASVGGREQLAIEAFADAVEVVPRTIAENAGMNAIDTVVDLRAAHGNGDTAAGVDVAAHGVGNAWDMGIVEPVRVKTRALAAATEVATMILRIDDVIASKPHDAAKKDGKK